MSITWTYKYTQAKDNRWSASGPSDETKALTVSGALALAQSTNRDDFLPTVSSGGACQGISIWWIIKRALGEDYWAWLGPPKKAAPASPNDNGKAGEPVIEIKKIMKLQAALGLTRPQNHDAAINYILSKTSGHLTRRRGLVLRTNTTFNAMGYEIAVARGYTFIGFSKSGWGGHAIAAHICNDGSVEFMDPNLGEFLIPTYKEFFEFMESVINLQVYKMKVDTFEIQTLQRPGGPV